MNDIIQQLNQLQQSLQSAAVNLSGGLLVQSDACDKLSKSFLRAQAEILKTALEITEDEINREPANTGDGNNGKINVD